MSVLLNVLLIDDDNQVFHALKEFAVEQGIVLQYARTLDEGMQALDRNSRILGVILDGKGLIHATDPQQQARAAFVHEALTSITLLEHKRGKIYPKCVLTAWYDQLIDSLEGRVRVFDKKRIALDAQLRSEMFRYMKVQIEDSEDFSVRTRYAKLFRLMDEKYVPPEVDDALYHCCVVAERGNATWSDFNRIRSNLYEMLLKQINLRSKALLPDALFHLDGRPNLDWTLRYLAGLPIHNAQREEIYPRSASRIPLHVHDCAQFVKEISSAFSHHSYDDTHSHHSFLAAFHAWIEFFLWYTRWVDIGCPSA